MEMLNAGSGPHYAKGWTNVDLVESGSKVDVAINMGDPYPFEDNYFDAAYLGHVIEHMPWADVEIFLAEINRVTKPGSPILIVGPDVLRTIELWRQGKQPWHMVLSTMEHQDLNYQPGRELIDWDGAHHYWNCHLERVVTLLHQLGFPNIEDYTSVIPVNPSGSSWLDPTIDLKWPVVGYHEWQFAVKTEGFTPLSAD